MTKDFFQTLSTQEFEVDGNIFQVDDYTSMIDISHILNEYEEEMLEYQVSNDERIEVSSYNIYESPNYWDMLLIINGIDDWTKLPVNQDKLEARKNDVYNEWIDTFGKFKNKEQKEAKLLELEHQIFLENEKYRNIKYIKKEKINEIKAKIREYVELKRSEQFQENEEIKV